MTNGHRVLWWLPELAPDPGGIATFAAHITPELARLGNDLHLFVAQGGPEETEHGGIPVVRLPVSIAMRNHDAKGLLQFRRDVTALKSSVAPDLYHVHLCEPSPTLHLTTAHVHPAPTVLTLHSQKWGDFYQTGADTLFGRLLAAARVITTVSTAAATDLIRIAPEVTGKVIVIPNGVDIKDDVTPVPKTATVLACGRIVPQKGFHRLIRSLPAVRSRVPDVHVRIAGDGPERASLQELSVHLGVDDLVTFLGHLDRHEIDRQYEWARAVVVPSTFEGMPYVVLEAGERGRPVVGSDIGGINEVIDNESNGLIIDPTRIDADPTILAEAIARVLTEPDLAETLGTRARERVVVHHSTQASAAAYDTVYRIGDRGPAPLVSVIIPAYQAQRFIAEAISSALDQGVDDIEIVVVDDGSTDDTAAIAAGVGGDKVCVLRQPNAGSAVARNSGMAISRGAFIAHLDADDIWPAGRLSALLQVLQEDESLDAVFGHGVEFAEDDAPANAQVFTESQSVRMPTTGLLRASSHARLGCFTPSDNGDMLTWSSQAIANGMRYREIPDVVLRRRIHSSNNSHRFPFLENRSRVAIIKQALDMKRRLAQADPTKSAD